MIKELFFIMIMMWVNGNLATWVYLRVKSFDSKYTRADVVVDPVIRNALFTAGIGKYGAFGLGIYIVGAVLGMYNL
jgi:hypothetical protein